MDTQMMDVDGDIILDVEPGMEVQDFSAQPEPDMDAGEIHEDATNNDKDEEMPAAYYESLDEFRGPIRPIPEMLNLQGVSDFGPNEPLDYALEHCPERRPKRLRWINDNSVNIEYYSAHEAADALLVLTHPDVERAALVPPQTSRKGAVYSKKPDSVLMVREANTGDQKEKNAADRSQYYNRNPQAREQKLQRKRREEKEPSPVFLDYGDEGAPAPNMRGGSYDDVMSDGERGTPNGSNRGRRPPNRARGDRNDRGGRNKDVDSYRPRSNCPRESRFGRLRDRSASPGSDGDGRYGFAEERSRTRRYRSRSRDNSRRQRSRSRERSPRRERGGDLESNRWEKDRYDPNQSSESGRWIKDGPISPMSHHRRSDATDETSKGSLLSRMTKDGRPVAPAGRSLASRITRDGDNTDFNEEEEDDDSEYNRPRRNDFASRITRDDNPNIRRNRSRSNDNFGGRLSNDRNNFGRQQRDDNFGRLSNDNNYNSRPRRNKDESYGRLKDDDSAPRETDFQEPTSRGNDLLDRVTWVRDGGNSSNGDNRRRDERGSSNSNRNQESGFSIRGTASGAPAAGGFSIRGAAGGE